MRSLSGITATALMLLCVRAAAAAGCGAEGVSVQVLGVTQAVRQLPSRAYLLWLDGRARALVDVGTGSAINFTGSGARAADLDAVLLRRLDLLHAGDLPTLVQLLLAEGRARALPIYGPDRSREMSSTVIFVRTLFDPKRGVYRYLGELLSPLGRNPYKLQPYDVETKAPPLRLGEMRLRAIELTVDPVRTLAWRIELAGKTLVVGSDEAAASAGLERLATAADLLLIDLNGTASRNATASAARALARLAQRAKVKQLAFAGAGLNAAEQERALRAAADKAHPGALLLPEPLGCLSL